MYIFKILNSNVCWAISRLSVVSVVRRKRPGRFITGRLSQREKPANHQAGRVTGGIQLRSSTTIRNKPLMLLLESSADFFCTISGLHIFSQTSRQLSSQIKTVTFYWKWARLQLYPNELKSFLVLALRYWRDVCWDMEMSCLSKDCCCLFNKKRNVGWIFAPGWSYPEGKEVI